MFIRLMFFTVILQAMLWAAPGDLDSSFGSDGIVTTDIGGADDSDSAYGVAIQSDGKIVAAGSGGNGSGSDFSVVRYSTDGSLDSSFGAGGKVITDTGGDHDQARSIAIQENGKIVVVGSRMIAGAFDFVVVRYNTDGTLDASFGTDGIAITDIGDGANSVAIQSDGKIVAVGFKWVSGMQYDFAAVRYNTNGTLDTSFGTDGIVITNVGGSMGADSVAIQSDGKIVAAGSEHIVRYNTNGTLDTSFGTDGIVTTDVAGYIARSVAIQSDGKIVAAGAHQTSSIAIVRYNTNGTLDTSFGTEGVVIVGGSSDGANSVAIQGNGKIVALGTGYGTDGNHFEVARCNTNGTMDTSFGASGLVTTVIGTYTMAFSVAIQGDGKIVAGGEGYMDSMDFAVVRYEGDPVTPPPTLPLPPIYYLLD